jgi:hypothetical protein
MNRNALEEIKNKITNSFDNEKLSSSIILYGPGSQLEKDQFVYEIAFYMSKMKRNVTKEKFFSLATSLSLPDFIIISKGSTGSIKVDEIKKIDDVISYEPFESVNRIFYIKDAQAMTHQAQNALLKKIEEPGSRNYFFLTTNKKNSLLRTITSRCISFYLPELIVNDMTDSPLLPESYFPFLNEIYELFDEIFIKSQMKVIELESAGFNPLRITSIDKINNIISDLGNFEPKKNQDREYLKRSVIKMRLAFFSYFLKNKYPEISEKIALFLNNRQFFSVDSSVFYNLTGDDIGK